MSLSTSVSLCASVSQAHATPVMLLCGDERRSESMHVCMYVTMCVEAGAHVGVHLHTCTLERGDLDLHSLP